MWSLAKRDFVATGLAPTGQRSTVTGGSECILSMPVFDFSTCAPAIFSPKTALPALGSSIHDQSVSEVRRVHTLSDQIGSSVCITNRQCSSSGARGGAGDDGWNNMCNVVGPLVGCGCLKMGAHRVYPQMIGSSALLLPQFSFSTIRFKTPICFAARALSHAPGA